MALAGGRPLNSALVSILLLAFDIPIRAQSVPAITEAQAREWAAHAVEKAAGSQASFDERFTNLARILAPSYRTDSSGGKVLYHSDELSLLAIGPVSEFQRGVSEAMRRLMPTDKTPWPCGVNVYVLPTQIGSPDIERIVVRRDGGIIEPTADLLIAQAMTTRAGMTRTVHRGTVCFPPSAFAPGSTVDVIAIPVTGQNIVIRLTNYDLQMIV
jgi:hypothetical protein